MRHIAKSALAGGVAISTIVGQPFYINHGLGYVAFVGTIAGFISVWFGTFINPFLERHIHVTEWTLLPGFLSAFVGMFGVGIVATPIVGVTQITAASYGQAFGMSILFGIGGGIVTGIILRLFGNQIHYEKLEDTDFWKR